MFDLFFFAFVVAALLVVSLLSYLRIYQKLLTDNTALVLALRLLGITFLFVSWISYALWSLPREYWIVKWILWVAAVIFLFGVLGFWFDRWSGRHKQPALIRLAEVIESIWLWKIEPKRRAQYEWHGRWRLVVFFRRIRRWWENFDWNRDLANLRPFYVLIAVGIAYGVLYLALGEKTTTTDWLGQMMNATDTGSATMKLALLGAPIAFVIWWFRDNNNRQQIENQRKDVNLKDFQKLAEWAAGMHLPEDKIVSGEKTTNDTKESTRSIETWASMSDVVLPAPNRREGAASLQIAAIYQLQAFLEGDYGRYFQRPAFQLLKSMWLALVSEHLKGLENSVKEAGEVQNALLNQQYRQLREITGTPLGRAINIAIGSAHGRVLRMHAEDLSNAVLAGFNSHLSGLSGALELDSLHGLRLNNLDWRGANLARAQLQAANLVSARLDRAEMGNAQLQSADLGFATLVGAYLFGTQLQGADLTYARLHRAHLSKAQLQGANLRRAQLQGATFGNCGWDERTNLKECKTDQFTKFFATNKAGAIDSIVTLELRKKLRTVNGLILPDILYERIFADDDPDTGQFQIE